MMDMLDWSSIDLETQQIRARMMSHWVQKMLRNFDIRKINFSIQQTLFVWAQGLG